MSINCLYHNTQRFSLGILNTLYALALVIINRTVINIFTCKALLQFNYFVKIPGRTLIMLKDIGISGLFMKVVKFILRIRLLQIYHMHLYVHFIR